MVQEIKKDKDLAELTKVCSEVLRVSRKYSYLWDESDIWKRGKQILLDWGYTAPDETYSIEVRKKGNRFVFGVGGKNFSGDCKGLVGKEAALKMREYGMTADELRETFYSSLKEVLGRYIGKRGLEKIKF